MSTGAPIVKLIVAVLSKPEVDPNFVAELLAEVFGSVDFVGEPHPFDCTDYYQEEMGEDLLRYLISFSGPHHADILVSAKRACIALEQGLAVDSKRIANLDCGYLDHHKLVLASTKGAGQKIYLEDGIYADLVARYSNSRYEALPWGFPDFKDGRYAAELNQIRRLFKGRELRSPKN